MTSSGALWLEPAFPHAGTTWAGPWWRQERPDGLTIAAMEHWAQRHLGRHSGRQSGKRLSAAECHHQCQCRWDCSCQKKEQVHLTQRHPRLFSSGTGNTWTHRVSAPRSSWHKSEGVWPRWRQTRVKQRSFSSACRSPSNASTRHA